MNDVQDFIAFARQCLDRQARHADVLPWERRECYADWLVQTYRFVCHSTRLLALAASRFGVKQDSLHLRFLDHLREEKSHEKLALADLRALDESPERYPEYTETRAFYQSQYYWIEHVNPQAFFGYILALEGLAALKGADIHERVKGTYGPQACSFIKVHSVEDHDHVEKLYEQLGRLSPSELAVVRDNLEQSCDLYVLMLNRVSARASVKHREAA